MVTEMDERQGIQVVYWENIRNHVSKIEENLALLIDELNLDRSFPLFLAHYPYGATIANADNTWIPHKGQIQKLSHPDIPKFISNHLGYGARSLPMGVILKKNIELFIQLKNSTSLIPWHIHPPGTFFPFVMALNQENNRIYTPNNILTMVSGARSVFTLPQIGCMKKHIHLQKMFNIHLPAPKSLHEHWYIFKELVNSPLSEAQWTSCLLFFPEKFVDHLHKDPAWMKLRLYLHELAWKKFQFRRNQIYYDLTFSVIQQKRNLKPNPYLVDTAKHLFASALGAVPAYVPTCDDTSLPNQFLQSVYYHYYDLNQYPPTIMSPIHYCFESHTLPAYYSLQNPATHTFSPKSRKLSSTLFEMRELEHIMRIFSEEFALKSNPCSDTVLHEMAKQVQFNYFHNEVDQHRIILDSNEIAKRDHRFHWVFDKNLPAFKKFACDAQFLRGCVSIQTLP